MNEQMLAKIEEERQKALAQSNSTYDSMQNDNKALYDLQNNNLNEYERIQNETLDKQLNFNEQKVEQQKEIARKNKEVEEKKARNDYAAFINPYGYQNENLAQRGLLNSGVSETSQLGGFNAYQNRLASANKVMQDAITQYDNDINEARLNNDVLKAQNALTKLQSQIEFAQTYYANKSNISQNRLSNNQSLESEYSNRYQNEVNRQEQIRQAELDRQEQIRQYNESLAFQKQQAAQEQANWEKQYAASQSSGSGRNYGIGTGNGNLESNISLNGYGIMANPYTGTINPDTKYGVFGYNGSEYGYQPNNIKGQKLKKSGKTVAQFTGMTGNVGSTGVNMDNQNVWTVGGRYYAWDGSQDKYVDITDEYQLIGTEKNELRTSNKIYQIR